MLSSKEIRRPDLYFGSCIETGLLFTADFFAGFGRVPYEFLNLGEPGTPLTDRLGLGAMGGRCFLGRVEVVCAETEDTAENSISCKADK